MPYGFPLLVTLMLIVPAFGVVPIPYVSEDHIQLDGELDDWSELLGPPLLRASDFSLWQGAPMHEKPLYVDFDPDNLDFRIWMGWSQPGRIFVAAEFQDDLVRDDPTAIFVQTDGLVISVTPDGREEVQNYAVRPRWIVPFPYSGRSPNWSTEAPFALAAWAELTPTSWAFEVFVTCFDVLADPDDSVVSDLVAGDEINLTLSVQEWDAHDTRSAWFNLVPSRAVLLSPGDTAVHQQTWGEVKALR